jgi:hypothetical protein
MFLFIRFVGRKRVLVVRRFAFDWQEPLHGSQLLRLAFRKPIQKTL